MKKVKLFIEYDSKTQQGLLNNYIRLKNRLKEFKEFHDDNSTKSLLEWPEQCTPGITEFYENIIREQGNIS